MENSQAKANETEANVAPNRERPPPAAAAAAPPPPDRAPGAPNDDVMIHDSDGGADAEAAMIRAVTALAAAGDEIFGDADAMLDRVVAAWQQIGEEKEEVEEGENGIVEVIARLAPEEIVHRARAGMGALIAVFAVLVPEDKRVEAESWPLKLYIERLKAGSKRLNELTKSWGRGKMEQKREISRLKSDYTNLDRKNKKQEQELKDRLRATSSFNAERKSWETLLERQNKTIKELEESRDDFKTANTQLERSVAAMTRRNEELELQLRHRMPPGSPQSPGKDISQLAKYYKQKDANANDADAEGWDEKEGNSDGDGNDGTSDEEDEMEEEEEEEEGVEGSSDSDIDSKDEEQDEGEQDDEEEDSGGEQGEEDQDGESDDEEGGGGEQGKEDQDGEGDGSDHESDGGEESTNSRGNKKRQRVDEGDGRCMTKCLRFYGNRRWLATFVREDGEESDCVAAAAAAAARAFGSEHG